MTKLKIRSIGTSCGVILPKEILERLNVSEGDDLFVYQTRDGLKLTPYTPEFEKAMEIAKDIAKRYRNALRELADS